MVAYHSLSSITHSNTCSILREKKSAASENRTQSHRVIFTRKRLSDEAIVTKVILQENHKQQSFFLKPDSSENIQMFHHAKWWPADCFTTALQIPLQTLFSPYFKYKNHITINIFHMPRQHCPRSMYKTLWWSDN